MSAIISYLKDISLNAVLTNKLTVMRQRLPQQFQHSLIVAFMCLFLGKLCKLADGDMQLLANIGLFHDLGVLHIDPLLLDMKQDINAEQWRQIHSHPLIGYLILKEQRELNPLINNAILEHHERMDGSGYPRNLKGNEISYLGRLIAVAETAIGICQKDSCEHLTTILKANINTLDNKIVQTLNHALYEASLKNANNQYLQTAFNAINENTEAIQEMAITINTIFSFWYKRHSLSNCEPDHVLNARIDTIRRSLIQSGISPVDTLQQINPYAEEPTITTEVVSLLRETLFQLNKILDEAARRKADQKEYDAAAKEWMAFAEKRLSAYNQKYHSLL
jgi:hypothetical protein